jgi:hypothetical protein
MLIYRLENEEGEGCYSRGFGTKCSRQALAEDQAVLKEYHPSPEYDPKLQHFWGGFHLTVKEMRKWPSGDRRNWLCAFESLEQLEKWFPAEGIAKMNKLAKHHKDSMSLVIYKVPHHKVRKGEAQVLYHKEHAVMVERISLEDLITQISG